MKLAVADVETTMIRAGETPRTLFWGLSVEGESYRRFPSTRALFRYLAQAAPLMVYCHHDYDMVQSLVDGETLEIRTVRDGRILEAFGPASVIWRNSHALFPSALKEILEACGYKKPALGDLEARNRADTEDALKAFRTVSESYERAFGVYPLGGDRLTSAGCAFAAAEREAGPLPQDLRYRECYRGGRVEAFRLGDCGQSSLFDLNSSYPTSFLEAPDFDHLLWCQVEIEPSSLPTPFFDLVSGPTKKLMFPAGRFLSAFYESNFMQYYAQHSGIKGVKALKRVRVDMRWLHRVGKLVQRAYAERLTAERREDRPTSYAIKIALNCIYGRLGMKPVVETCSIQERVPDGDETSWYDMGPHKHLVFRKGRRIPRSNYSYAAYITDNARARLYHALRSVGDPFYCDTDAIFVRAGLPGPKPQGVALGEWKLEGSGALTVRSAKDYVFSGEETRKGGSSSLCWTLKQAFSTSKDGSRPGARMIVRRRLCACSHARHMPGGPCPVRGCNCLSWQPYDKRTVLCDGRTEALVVDRW